MSQLVTIPYITVLDDNGNPIAGAVIKFTLTGTTTPASVYSDPACLNALGATVACNAAGRAADGSGNVTPIYLAAATTYRLRVFETATATDPIIDNDPVYNLAGQLSQGSGASLIGFLQAGTGAVARTAQAKMREIVSAADFGVVADGATDDTAAMQAAIDYLKPIGGALLLPSGTIKITASLNWISTVNAGLPGILFVGKGGTGGPNGGPATTIKSYITDGPLFQIQGTKSQSAGGTGSLFINGGGMSGICLDGANASGTSQGIRVNGWQYGVLEDLTIQNFPGDGITQWTDSGYATPDFSASDLVLNAIWFWNNIGWGVNQTGAIGAPSWIFNKCLFGYNKIGGALVTSSGQAFLDCSFVGSGWDEARNAGASFGCHIQVGSSQSVNRITIRRCEFDFARLSHVNLDFCQTAVIEQNRFIFDDRNSTGSLTPTVGAVLFANISSSSNVTQCRLTENQIRIDTAGICNIWKLVNRSNVSDIIISDYLISNNIGATVNEFVGDWQTGDANFRQNYSGYNSATNVHIPGKPLPQYIGLCSSATVPSAANLIYGTQETVNGLIFGSAVYNTTTGVFTAKNTGYHRIRFGLCVVTALTTDYFQFQLQVGGVTVQEFDFGGNGRTATFMMAEAVLFLTAADAVTIKSVGANGHTITAANSQLMIEELASGHG